MNFKNLKIAIVSSIMLVATTTGYSQNNNVVSAALEYQNYMPSLYKKDIDGAKEHLVEAKRLIDLAMNNESTKDDPKANYYNAVINFSLIELASIDSTDLSLNVYQNDSIEDVIKESAEKAYKKGRWKGEMQDFFKQKVEQAVGMGQMFFEKKKYNMAFEAFSMAYQVKQMTGNDKDLDAMKTNAIVSARQYIDTLKKTEKNEEAIKFISSVLEMFPNSEDVAIDGINLALSTNDLVKAEEYFQIVVKATPDNKELYSTMGSMFLQAANKGYSELSGMDPSEDGYQEKSKKIDQMFAKAEEDLLNAVRIDSNYADANYNLGVLYLSKGEKLKTKASRMDFNNPNYEKVKEESTEMYRKAIAPLEIYIKTDPDNAGVLRVLFQVYRNTGDNDKALEYKRRADEADAKGK